MNSVPYVSGLACGVFVAVLALAFARRRIYGKAFGSSNRVYDERQQLARGEAYKAAFYTAMLWMAVSALIRDWMDTSVQMTMGIRLSVCVFAFVCIKKDAYLSLRERPARCIRWFLLIAAVNLFPTVVNLVHGNPFIENGVVTHRATNLIVAVMLLVVTLATVLRQRQIRMEEQTEEDA